MSLGVVVGMVAEARIARRLGDVEIGGGMPAGAEAAAERLVAGGATALLSFGLAGGLDPLLRPGTVVVPASVLADGRHYATNAELTRALGGATVGLLLAGERVVATVAEKRRLGRETGAAAVDLESGAVARVAARTGAAFAVLRAVCDGAEEALPPVALMALGAGGRIGGARVAGAVLRQPWQIGGLIRLGWHAFLARRALVGAAERLLGHLG